ncbi:hypothetical protein I4U23_011100 [Adineta vaga]|nr:hypothetical protein I4U23_011100 [Adineta vaga]
MNEGNRKLPSSSQLTGTHDVSRHGSSVIRVVKSSRLNNQHFKNNTRSTNVKKVNNVIHTRIRSPKKLSSVDAMNDLPSFSLRRNAHHHPQSGQNQSSTIQKSNKLQTVNNTETIQYHQPGSTVYQNSWKTDDFHLNLKSSIVSPSNIDGKISNNSGKNLSKVFSTKAQTFRSTRVHQNQVFYLIIKTPSKILFVFIIALLALLITAAIVGIVTGIVMTRKNTTTGTTITATTHTTTSQTTSTTTTSATTTTTSATTTTTTTTTTTSVTTTTVTTTTTTRPVICPSAVWHPNGTTVAGSSSGSAGSTTSLLSWAYDVRVDSAFNVYVADYGNYRFMKWSPNSTNGTVIGPKLGVGSSADTQHLNTATTLCFDSTESNLYLSDTFNCRILKLNIASGNITVVIGSGCGNALNQIDWCDGLYIDRFDNIYVADWINDRVLKFPPSSNLSTNGVIVAGTGVPGSALNQLDTPWNIYVDESDNDTLDVQFTLMKGRETTVASMNSITATLSSQIITNITILTTLTTTTVNVFPLLCDEILESKTVNISHYPCEQIRCTVILRRSGGRLGNRMFMFASAYGLARTHNCRLYVNNSILGELSDSFQIKGINERMWLSHEEYMKLTDIQEKSSICSFKPELIQLNAFRNIELFGYWQSYLYFDAYREEIREIFSARQETLVRVGTYLRKITTDICSSCLPLVITTQKELRYTFQTQYNIIWIGIHIRRRDFIKLGFLSNDDYISYAMNHFRRRYHYKQVRFLIASDDKGYCLRRFAEKRRRKNVFILPQNFSPADDLLSLTSCHHSIVTGGTYGFWSAYLTGGEVIHDVKYQAECASSDYYPPWFVLTGKPVRKF